MHGIEKFHLLHQQKPVVQRLNVNFIRELLLICGWPREECLCWCTGYTSCAGVQAIHLVLVYKLYILCWCTSYTSCAGVQAIHLVLVYKLYILCWCTSYTSCAGVQAIHLVLVYILCWCTSYTSCAGVQAIHLISRLFWVRTLIFTLSLVPRPPPRLYLAAVEKSREKVWAEAWERGYFTLPPYLLGTIVLADCTLTVRESVPLYRHAWTKLVAKVVMRFAYRSGCCYSLRSG